MTKQEKWALTYAARAFEFIRVKHNPTLRQIARHLLLSENSTDHVLKHLRDEKKIITVQAGKVFTYEIKH